MSSWKVETRAHQERSQPKARKKFGLLEKAQDYKKRAAAHHRKEKRIQSMKLKAEFKNPDEFYFGMVNAQTKVRNDMCQANNLHDMTTTFRTEWSSQA